MSERTFEDLVERVEARGLDVRSWMQTYYRSSGMLPILHGYLDSLDHETEKQKWMALIDKASENETETARVAQRLAEELAEEEVNACHGSSNYTSKFCTATYWLKWAKEEAN